MSTHRCLDSEAFKTLYTTYVRLTLEYAVSEWKSHSKKERKAPKLQRIKKLRTTNLVSELRELTQRRQMTRVEAEDADEPDVCLETLLSRKSCQKMFRAPRRDCRGELNKQLQKYDAKHEVLIEV